MPTIEEKDARRRQLLERLYDRVGGRTVSNHENFRQLAYDLGMDEEDAGDVAQWLVEHGLARWSAYGGWMRLTPQGVDTVEDARRAGTSDPGRIRLDADEVVRVRHLLGELERAVELDDGAGDPDDRAELVAHLATLAAQMGSPRADRGVVAATLRAIRRSADGTGIALVALGALDDL